MYNYPIMRPGIFARGLNLTKSINWGGLLDGTQKTLGVINQAIPIVYQVKPIISNARTMFKIADQLDVPDKNNNSIQDSSSFTSSNSNKPIFYI